MEEILKGAILAGSSAYVSNFVTQKFNLGSALGATSSSPFINDVRGTFAPQMILDRLGDQVVSAGISNVFNGRPFFEGLDNLGRTFLVTETMALVQFGIGEMGNGMDTKWEGSLPHMLLHGGVGCIAIEALRGNCASGFFAGVSQSVLAGSNLTDAQKLQLAPLVGAVAGFFGAEGQAIGVSYAASIAQSGMVNNYLTHEQWKRLTAALASCKGDQLCIDRTWTAYEVLSRQQNDAYVTCVANGDMQCIQNVRDELSLVDFAENKALISRTLADLGLGGRRYADLLDLDQTALNITEVVYGDANHITREEAQAAFALDRAMLCTASMPLATCLQTITDARRDRGNAALGLIADLIPILGDAKGAAECLLRPSVLTCGGALLGVFPLAGDVTKVLIRQGDEVIAITRSGENVAEIRLITANPQVVINRQNGSEFEQQVVNALSSVGGVKNTTPATVTLSNGAVVTTIPDLWSRSVGGLLEVKNVLSLSLSPQLRAQAELARATGQPMNLVVSPRTQYVSNPLLNEVRSTGGNVYIYDPVIDDLQPW